MKRYIKADVTPIGSESLQVKFKVARDPKTRLSTLARLATDSIPAVRYAVLKNPNITEELRDSITDSLREYITAELRYSMDIDWEERGTINVDTVETIFTDVFAEYRGLLVSFTSEDELCYQYLSDTSCISCFVAQVEIITKADAAYDIATSIADCIELDISDIGYAVAGTKGEISFNGQVWTQFC